MPRPYGHIRILLSARVLFDLEEADKIFAEKGAAEYADYMRGRGNYAADYDEEMLGRRLKPGPLWHFALAALKLNEKAHGTVDLGVICKDEAETALPIFRNLDVSGVLFGYRIATSSHDVKKEDLEAFGADLFFSRNPKDVQLAIDNDVAAATINFPPGAVYERKASDPVRLWLDGDAVTFGSSAELTYKKEGHDSYRRHEFNNVAKPIEAGPFTKLLAKISALNQTFPANSQPFEISLLTARGDRAAARVIPTLESLGIKFNGPLYFVDGVNKSDVLKAHRPDLFLDDQQVHLGEASAFCPTGHVAYKTGTAIHTFLKEQAEKNKPETKGPAPGQNS